MSRRLEKNILAVWKKNIKTNYCINLPKKKKNSARQPICLALFFLANVCSNLSYILYRKFPIGSVLRCVFWLIWAIICFIYEGSANPFWRDPKKLHWIHATVKIWKRHFCWTLLLLPILIKTRDVPSRVRVLGRVRVLIDTRSNIKPLSFWPFFCFLSEFGSKLGLLRTWWPFFLWSSLNFEFIFLTS